MPYAYDTVMIGSQPYYVYGDSDSATLYLQADMSAQATAWLAADASTKARSLVSAVRWMDEQNWLGNPTDLVTPQALQWPRQNVTDAYGQAIDENTIPPQIIFAEFELAAWLVSNPDIRAELQNPGARSLSAGSVSITYFRPVGGAFGAQDVQTVTPFPKNVMDLIGRWLGGGPGTTAALIARGYDSESPFDDYPGVLRGF